MKVEVSDGEVLDKLSILEIKLDNIEDEAKLVNIKKEHAIKYEKKYQKKLQDIEALQEAFKRYP